jgi:hypothetical protein
MRPECGLAPGRFAWHFFAVRSAFLIVPLLLAAAPAFAKPKPEAEPPPSSLRNLSNPDPTKVFNIDKALAHRNVPGTFQSSKSNSPKEFYIQQKFSPKGYETRDFSGKKQSWFASLKFWAKDANLYSRNEIPNATKAAAVKTAPTKDARESSKTAATRELPGSHRQYLGPEAAKIAKGINPNDPNAQPRIVNEMHELKTVEDIKALLNKN